MDNILPQEEHYASTLFSDLDQGPQTRSLLELIKEVELPASDALFGSLSSSSPTSTSLDADSPRTQDGIDPAPRQTTAKPAERLLKLAQIHSILERHADELEALRRRLEASGILDGSGTEAASDRLCDVMYQVAWLMASIPAKSNAELAAKSRVLLGWVGCEKDNVVDQLTKSLCLDFLNRQSEEQHP